MDGRLLSSEKLVKELLETLLTDCEALSIILDGLDECTPVEERKIIGWLRSVIEPLNRLPNGRKGPRCVFVSQRDATSTKLLRDIPSLSITPTQNHNDILNFVALGGRRLQDKFLLSEDVRDNIVALVAEKAGGEIALRQDAPVTRDSIVLILEIPSRNVPLRETRHVNTVCSNLPRETVYGDK